MWKDSQVRVRAIKAEIAKAKKVVSRKVSSAWEDAKKFLLRVEASKAREHSNMAKAEDLVAAAKVGSQEKIANHQKRTGAALKKKKEVVKGKLKKQKEAAEENLNKQKKAAEENLKKQTEVS